MRTHAQRDPEELEGQLLALIEAAREKAPRGSVRQPHPGGGAGLTRRIDRGEVGEAGSRAWSSAWGAQALTERAAGCAPMSGSSTGPRPTGPAGALVGRGRRGGGSFEAYRDGIGRPRFAAVFTAHPTFGMPQAWRAAGRGAPRRPAARRALLGGGRDSRSGRTRRSRSRRVRAGPLRGAPRPRRAGRVQPRAPRAARGALAGAWTELVPRPSPSPPGSAATRTGAPISAGGTRCATGSNRSRAISPASCSGCRLTPPRPRCASIVAARARGGRAPARARPAAGAAPSLEALQAFALAIVHERETALPDAAAPRRRRSTGRSRRRRTTRARAALALLRAGCAAHGVSIALPHFRLNASQLHNALRGIVDARRRADAARAAARLPRGRERGARPGRAGAGRFRRRSRPSAPRRPAC